MEKVWGYTFDGSKRTVDVISGGCGRKLNKNPEKPKILITIIGFGYKFDN